MSGLVEFKIDVLANGKGSVILDGEDVSDRVSGFTLQARVGQPPLLMLQHITGQGAIEGEGIVQVSSSEEPGNSSEIIRKFLSAVDPDELDSAALEQSGWGDTGIARSMLRVLTRWAGGD